MQGPLWAAWSWLKQTTCGAAADEMVNIDDPAALCCSAEDILELGLTVLDAAPMQVASVEVR